MHYRSDRRSNPGATLTSSGVPSEEAAGRRVPEDLERVARLLDSSIKLPGGFRIGIDGLIGLIPGVGDAAGAVLSLYVLGRAWALGLPKAVLARMFLNVAVDSIGGSIPLLGDLFDLTFKSNQRNIELLRRYMRHGERERRSSWMMLAVVGVALILLAALVIALGILLARLLAAAF